MSDRDFFSADDPPTPARRGLTRRELLQLGGPALLALVLGNLRFSRAFAAPALDPPLTDSQVLAWFPDPLANGLGQRIFVEPNNDVTTLVDGTATFASMVQAMKTATDPDKHFIYLLGWWLTDQFELIPGDKTSTVQALLKKASDAGVQVRAMLWCQGYWGKNQNRDECKRINALKKGAAIYDNRTLNIGSHHQKILAVNGSDGLITFCGGLDINPDRIAAKGTAPNAAGDTKGAPLHDVHCRVKGPAAGDLLRIFVDRWKDHPGSGALDTAKGALLGDGMALPNIIAGKKNWVQIGRTFGNGGRNAGIAGTKESPEGYDFAPDGEQSAARMIIRGIQQARNFIYVEDQYFVDTAPTQAAGLDVRAALIAALAQGSFKHLTVVIPANSITDLAQRAYRRRLLIAALKQADLNGTRFRIFNPKPAGNNHTYVHAKTWIFDDQYAIIGSANCNRRSFTHDSEVVAGIVDQGQPDSSTYYLPHQLRMQLWAEHLNVAQNLVVDPIANANLWLNLPVGAKVEPFDENAGMETLTPDGTWNGAYDPDGS